MFARTVRMQLKPNSATEFTRLLEKEVIPLLRKQQGFKDEITFVPSGGTEAVAISLWEQKENADAYSRGAYPDVLKAMAKVVEGTPQVQTSHGSPPPRAKMPRGIRCRNPEGRWGGADTFAPPWLAWVDPTDFAWQP